MPFNTSDLVGSLNNAFMAGMVPPDTPEEAMPDVQKKVAEMAQATAAGMQPLIDFVNDLENRLHLLETQTIPQIQALNQSQDQAFEDFIAGDFGDLLSKTTGLEGDVGDLKTKVGGGSGASAGNTP